MPSERAEQYRVRWSERPVVVPLPQPIKVWVVTSAHLRAPEVGSAIAMGYMEEQAEWDGDIDGDRIVGWWPHGGEIQRHKGEVGPFAYLQPWWLLASPIKNEDGSPFVHGSYVFFDLQSATDALKAMKEAQGGAAEEGAR